MWLWCAYLLMLLLIVLQIPLLLRTSKAKKMQNQMVVGLQGQRCWRVNVAEPLFLQRLWRTATFQGKGVLIDAGEQLRLQVYWLKTGQQTDWVANKAQLKVEYLGTASPWTANSFSWASLHDGQQTLIFSPDIGVHPQSSREALADILRSVFPAYPLSAVQPQHFALEKNKRSLSLMVIFFVGVAALLLEQLFNTRFELIELQWSQWLRLAWLPVGVAVVALLIAVGLYRFLRAGKVPANESIILAILLSGLAVFAAWPLTKSIDRFLAARDVQLYPYVLHDRKPYLLPAQQGLGLPPLTFVKSSDYWAQFPLGSQHQIPLLRGALGLWQLDHARFDPPLLAFYEAQKQQEERAAKAAVAK